MFELFGKKKQPPIRSLIAEGNHFEGNITFSDGLRIDGSLQGNVCANEDKKSILVISETACLTGEVCADHVIVNGTVKGPVYARDMLELQPKARIEGNVRYERLEMHQGAQVNGELRPLALIDTHSGEP